MLLYRALRKAWSVVNNLDRVDAGRVWPLSMLSARTKKTLVRKFFKLFTPFLSPTKVDGLVLDMPYVIKYGLKGVEDDTKRVMESCIRPGMVVIDVGANIGYLSLLAAKFVGPEGKVYALEPGRKNLESLRKNIENNGFGNIEVLPCAAGATSGPREFHLYGAGNLDSFYVRPDLSAPETVTVDTVRLDDVVKCKVDFVKIDVEGAEIEVLRGMDNILASNEEIRLIIELNPICLQSAGHLPEELPKFLIEKGFSIFILDKTTKTPVDMDEIDSMLKNDSLKSLGGYANIFAERTKG